MGDAIHTKRNKAIFKKIQSGISLEKVMAEFNVSPHVVYTAIRANRPPSYKPPYRIAKEKRDKEITKIVLSGKPVQEVADKFGVHPLTITRAVKKSYPGYHKIIRELGFKKHLARALVYAKKTGTIPNSVMFVKLGIQGLATSYCHNELLKKGYKDKKGKHYTHEELLNELKRIGSKVKRTPGAQDIIADSKYSFASYYHYFGSLQNAQKLAGFIPNKRGRTYPEKNKLPRSKK
jgi:DNA-binding CsgD family transcriptional regulator